MNLVSLITSPMRYRLWRMDHLKLIASDMRSRSKQAVGSDEEHLRSVIGWICRAQDRREGENDAGSVSAGWSFEDGWLPGYPETSGYIIETLLAADTLLPEYSLRERAKRILDWELSIRQPDGAFPGHFGESGSQPVIFNTGQIMHGLVAGYLEFGREDCLDAAVRAGRWLVTKQDGDGCWRQSVHNGIPHTYNTRAAWALLRTGMLAGESSLKLAAIRNIEWALTQQTDCGWFKQNAFLTDHAPFTHNIAYAIRGVLESGVLLEDERLLKAATRAASGLRQQLHDNGWLAGTFEDNWTPRAYYCCLTGLAQSGIIWQRLYQLDGDTNWSDASDRALIFLKKHHRRTGNHSPEDGGIAGSSPLWGRYSMFEYPNWAAKFFADLILIKGFDIVVPSTEKEQENVVNQTDLRQVADLN